MICCRQQIAPYAFATNDPLVDLEAQFWRDKRFVMTAGMSSTTSLEKGEAAAIALSDLGWWHAWCVSCAYTPGTGRSRHTCSPRRKGCWKREAASWHFVLHAAIALAIVYRGLPSRQMSSIVLRPSSHTVPLQRRFCRLFSASSCTQAQHYPRKISLANFLHF